MRASAQHPLCRSDTFAGRSFLQQVGAASQNGSVQFCAPSGASRARGVGAVGAPPPALPGVSCSSR